MSNPRSFRLDDETWAAFVAKCEERGVPPATKVAELVTGWARTSWPADDADWTRTSEFTF